MEVVKISGRAAMSLGSGGHQSPRCDPCTYYTLCLRLIGSTVVHHTNTTKRKAGKSRCASGQLCLHKDLRLESYLLHYLMHHPSRARLRLRQLYCRRELNGRAKTTKVTSAATVPPATAVPMVDVKMSNFVGHRILAIMTHTDAAADAGHGFVKGVFRSSK